MTVERYGNAVELRADGRRISGTVVLYGETADSRGAMILPGAGASTRALGARRERFAPRSYVATVPAVALNIEHRQLQAAAWYPDGGMELIDDEDALRFTADLPAIPAGDMALDGVRSGKYKGVSIEFRALAERMQAGERVIERYELHGIGLTERPVFSGSTVEARQIETAAIRGTIQADGNAIYDCECLGGRGSALCKVRFEVGSFDKVLERVEAARESAGRQPSRPMLPPDVIPAPRPATIIPPAPVLPQVEAQNVVAHIGSFRPADILGDTNSGNLILQLLGGVLFVGLEPAAVETEAGQSLIQAAEVADVHMRPLIDFDLSEYTDEDDIRVYTDAWITSLLFKTALRSEGWTPIDIVSLLVGASLAPGPDTLFL